MNLPHPKGWSSDKHLWDSVRALCGELEWNCVPFDTARQFAVPADKGGVYAICASAPTDDPQFQPDTVLYVGKVTSTTRGLRTRFREHTTTNDESLRRFLRCYFPNITFWFAVVRGTFQTGEIEDCLIRAFNPPCNRIAASGSIAIQARLLEGRAIVPVAANSLTPQ